jgi:hypothetical protein
MESSNRNEPRWAKADGILAELMDVQRLEKKSPPEPSVKLDG